MYLIQWNSLYWVSSSECWQTHKAPWSGSRGVLLPPSCLVLTTVMSPFTVSCLSCLVSFTACGIHPLLLHLPVVCFFFCWVIFHCVNFPSLFIHSSLKNMWVISIVFGIYEWFSSECSCTVFLWTQAFISFGEMSRRQIAGLFSVCSVL